MLETGTILRLRRAFPSSIAAEVDAALAVVPRGSNEPTDRDIGPVRVAGEVVHIPSRIYSPEPPVEMLDALDNGVRTVLTCLYTRHHDGHVREKHLRGVISSSADWVPPFVVQLLGEYVVEVHRVIESNLDCLGQQSYARFVGENLAFMELTKQRVISYWNCYFKRVTSKVQDHGAFRVLEALESGQLAGCIA